MLHKHKGIRSTCKKCKKGHTRNEERFHGFGSYCVTHPAARIVKGKKKCCGSQNESRCYIEGHKKRNGSKKKVGSTVYVSFSGKNTRKKPKNWIEW